jgi:two-component system, chemotaxis family, chemotaxis protein CheY
LKTQQPSSANPPPTTTGPTLLVVEDDVDVREALAECLTDAGYQVDSAGDGSAALLYLASHPAPAAILLDLFMPVMDGWEFLKRIRANSQYSTIPVIVLTAAGEHWGYPVPRSMLLRKPVDAARMLQLIETATASAPAP